MIQQLIGKFTAHPRQLILVDGMGTLVTAFFLLVVLHQLEIYFGIPYYLLQFLAIFPFLFFIFDLFVYLKVKDHYATYLKLIASFNWGYCLVSLSVMAYHYGEIKPLGMLYLFGEIVIVFTIAYIEWLTAKNLKSKNQVTK